MKILLFGGSGILGTELKKLRPDIIAPPHEECDITDHTLLDTIEKYQPDLLINSAAIKDNRSIEKHAFSAIQTNIIGAAHVAECCLYNSIRYIFISTDYVYEGSRGNYLETDPVLPANIYAYTKLAGECSARTVKNHLIIRTSFGPDKFEYKEAFIDKWSSKDYVGVIAPMILEAAVSPLTGVLNIGTERKTLYDYASKLNNVKGVKLTESSHTTPYDTSLNLQKWINYKSENPTAKPHTNCRVCGSDKLTKYLDLGLMPLANNLEFTSNRAKEKERFPLQVLFCQECGLSQLSVVIDPVKMYGYYTYRSGVNAPYIEHCRKMALSLAGKYAHLIGFHIDIAGNDGTLLTEFKKIFNSKVLNVDPASNLTAISEANGVHAITDFWSTELASKIIDEYGRADLITATNVFAHVDNVRDFICACYIALNPEGILVIECPYIVDFIDNMEYDTIYFEHVSVMSILPMHRLCSDLQMNIIDVEKFGIHGGTIRVTITKESSSHKIQDSVFQFANKENEEGFNRIEVYKKWDRDVNRLIKNFGFKILELKRQGFKIAGFAASAKGNTLLNASGINTDIMDYIVDETPEKIGKFSPGTGIPIVYKQMLKVNPPDYLVILSWNFADFIMQKVRAMGYEGAFIIPIPEFKIVENVAIQSNHI